MSFSVDAITDVAVFQPFDRHRNAPAVVKRDGEHLAVALHLVALALELLAHVLRQGGGLAGDIDPVRVAGFKNGQPKA